MKEEKLFEFIGNIDEKYIAEARTEILDFSTHKKRLWSKRRVAIAVIAAVLMTSTIAFAGTKLFGMYVRQDGKYSIFVGIEDPEKNILELPEKVCDIRFEPGYFPEGMVPYGDYRFHYEGAHNLGGIGIWSYLLDQKDIGKDIFERGVIESEELELNGHSGVYVKYLDLKEDGSYDKRIYLLYPEVQRVIVVYGGDDVSKEDTFKFAENLKVTKGDELLETEGMMKWSSLWEPSEGKDESIYEVRDNKIKTLHVGDAVEISAPYGNLSTCAEVSVSLECLVVTDDFSLLEKEFIPDEWYDLLDEKGKLKKNHLYYVKRGDGIRTLDKVVNESDVAQKVVYVTMTYTNLSKVKVDKMVYHGNLLYLKHENRKYRFYNPFRQGNGYDYVMADGLPAAHWWSYFKDEKDQTNEENYIDSLGAGESVRVEMAWIVNEDDLANLYLNVCDGAMMEYSQAMTTTGIYKLMD